MSDYPPRFIEYTALCDVLDSLTFRNSSSSTGTQDDGVVERSWGRHLLDLSVSINDIVLEDSLMVYVSYGGDPWCRYMLSLLVEALDKIKMALAPGMSSCYIWLDSVCSAPHTEISLVSPYETIFSKCDLMLTPMYDPGLSLAADVYVKSRLKYDAKPWNFGPNAYLNRGNCCI